MAAQQAASARAASVVSAHTTGQIISVVTIQAADQPAVVAVALAVVFDALHHRCRIWSLTSILLMRRCRCRK